MDVWLERVYIGNSLQACALAAVAFLATFTLLPLVRRLILSQRGRLEGMSAPPGVDLALLLIARTSRVFLWAVALGDDGAAVRAGAPAAARQR